MEDENEKGEREKERKKTVIFFAIIPFALIKKKIAQQPNKL